MQFALTWFKYTFMGCLQKCQSTHSGLEDREDTEFTKSKNTYLGPGRQGGCWITRITIWFTKELQYTFRARKAGRMLDHTRITIHIQGQEGREDAGSHKNYNTHSGPGWQGGCWITQELQYIFRARKAGRMLDHTRITIHIQGQEGREDAGSHKNYNTHSGPGRQGGCWITQELQYTFRARKAGRMLDHTRITIHIQGQEGREDAGSHKNYNTHSGPGRQGGCWITQELQYTFRARKAGRMLDHTRITIHIQGQDGREDAGSHKNYNTYSGPGRQEVCWITQELQYTFRARKAGRMLDHTRITIHIQGQEGREDAGSHKNYNTHSGPGRQGGCWITQELQYTFRARRQGECWITQELQYIFRARKAGRMLDHTRITIHIQGQEGREDAGSHKNYNTHSGPGRQGGCWITQELQYTFRARKAGRMLDHTRITIHIQGQKAGRMLDHTRITIHIQGQEGREDAGSHKNYNTYSGPGRQGGCWITQELQYIFRARKAGSMLDHTRITIHIQGQEGREDAGSHKNYNTHLGPGRQGGCWITQELQYTFRARKAGRMLDHTRITIHIQGQKAGRMLDHTRVTIHIQGQEGREDARFRVNYTLRARR